MVMSSRMFAGVSTGHAQEQCAWQLRHGDFAAALSSRGSFCSGGCGSSLPQVWVRTLQLVCTAVDSNADLLGPPIPRDIRTFPSLAGLQDVENEQVK